MAQQTTGQPQMLDQVVAVVGSKIVLLSDIQQRYMEYVAENMVNNNSRCQILEDYMFEKLLLAEAEKDTTMVVSDAQVDEELNKRMEHFVSQFPTKEKFEANYGKTVEQFKEEYRPDVKDLLLSEQMRNKIIEGITISPEEVRKYFESIPKDSVPDMNSQVEIGIITKMPIITDDEDAVAKQKCQDLRERVIKGESMATLAILYSADPGSAHNGGEYKNIKRGEFVPEFDKVAFGLADGEISDVFKTPFGYHFIQLEKRHGQFVDLRHILIMAKVSDADLQNCADTLNIISKIMRKDSLSFAEAAAKFSDDKNTKFSGGLLTNPQTGLTRFDMNQIGQIDASLAFTLNDMKIGDISSPQPFSTPDAKQGYRLIYLKNRTKPHKANLVDDYQQIQAAALSRKQQKVIADWINRKLKEGIYVHIDPAYTDCKFQNNWTVNP